MVSERVMSSIVGTNPADEPNVKFWKSLHGQYVSDDSQPCFISSSAYPLDAVYLVIEAYALTNAGTDALWKHSS